MSHILVENIKFAYSDEGNKEYILDNINLEIKDGEFICLIGHSGCGKTSLLRLLAGLEMPSSGRIFIDGKELLEPSNSSALVFQQYSLFPWMKVRKNVAFCAMHSVAKPSKNEAYTLADKWLKKVGMLEASNKYPYQLSGGMKQRVAIARALVMEPNLLLLDEPFGALDARRRLELQCLMESLCTNFEKKRNVIFVTHDIDEALLLADRIVFMTPKHIKRIIDIPFSRPRVGSDISLSADYAKLRHELMELFYLDGGLNG